MNLSLASWILLIFSSIVIAADWKPTNWEQCRTNTDCQNSTIHCCSITPALGKRQVNFPAYVKYCLPYKVESAPWCELRLQFDPLKANYFGLCPCGPGLRCTPTSELNTEHYPKEKFGKCKPVM